MTQYPQWPPAPQQPSAPTGMIRLDLQGSQWSNLVVPTVKINGHPVPVRYGLNDLPVWAGVNDLHVHCQWAWQYGVAEERLEVPPGAVVERHYAMPWMTFFKGALGPTKQKRPGLGCFVSVFAVPGVIIVLAVIIGAMNSRR
jgi:hypothetical protein